ncbi:ribonuclease E/G [Cupriavidus basilensis]
MIDQTEAHDDRSTSTPAATSGARNFDDTIFKTNLEAAHTIARQLRLRNLGGIIIIDFIDMEIGRAPRPGAGGTRKRALSRDRTRITVNSFSQLGLVEMTRKRTRESLGARAVRAVPRVPRARARSRRRARCATTSCAKIMRESRQFNPREFRILALAVK